MKRKPLLLGLVAACFSESSNLESSISFVAKKLLEATYKPFPAAIFNVFSLDRKVPIPFLISKAGLPKKPKPLLAEINQLREELDDERVPSLLQKQLLITLDLLEKTGKPELAIKTLETVRFNLNFPWTEKLASINKAAIRIRVLQELSEPDDLQLIQEIEKVLKSEQPKTLDLCFKNKKEKQEILAKAACIFNLPFLKINCKNISKQKLAKKIHQAIGLVGSSNILIFLENVEKADKNATSAITKLKERRLIGKSKLIKVKIHKPNLIITTLTKSEHDKPYGFTKQTTLTELKSSLNFEKLKFDLFHLPPHALAVAKKIKKMLSCHTQEQDHQDLQELLFLVLSLPWHPKPAKTAANLSTTFQSAQKKLDLNHHGIKQIKDKVLEFLAWEMATKHKDGKVICFVGEPGTGKTSFAKSVAQALGREFLQVSLAGLSEGNQLKGWPASFKRAAPGVVLQAMTRLKYNNPVILLDEVDKMKRSAREPLLELLDPEQNHSFFDNFLTVPYNFSKVMFILAANSLDKISAPIRNRCHIVFFDGYTNEEKLAIAQKHLIPKITRNLELKYHPSITPEILMQIIKNTEEDPGIRSLKQSLETIVEKNICHIFLHQKPMMLTSEIIEEIMRN